MNKEIVLKKIMEIINDATEIPMEDMCAESSMMDDLEMSSLEIMTMISEVEKAFKIKIPAKATRGFVAIEDIADFILTR